MTASVTLYKVAEPKVPPVFLIGRGQRVSLHWVSILADSVGNAKRAMGRRLTGQVALGLGSNSFSLARTRDALVLV